MQSTKNLHTQSNSKRKPNIAIQWIAYTWKLLEFHRKLFHFHFEFRGMVLVFRILYTTLKRKWLYWSLFYSFTSCLWLKYVYFNRIFIKYLHMCLSFRLGSVRFDSVQYSSFKFCLYLNQAMKTEVKVTNSARLHCHRHNEMPRKMENVKPNEESPNVNKLSQKFTWNLIAPELMLH